MADRIRASRVLRLRPPVRRSLESIARSLELMASPPPADAQPTPGVYRFAITEVVHHWAVTSQGHSFSDSYGWRRHSGTPRTLTVIATDETTALAEAERVLPFDVKHNEYRRGNSTFGFDPGPEHRRYFVIDTITPHTTTSNHGDPS